MTLGYHDLGVFLVDQGKTAQAIQAFQAALRYDPSQVDVHKNLAALYAQRDLAEKPRVGTPERFGVAIGYPSA